MRMTALDRLELELELYLLTCDMVNGNPFQFNAPGTGRFTKGKKPKTDFEKKKKKIKKNINPPKNLTANEKRMWNNESRPTDEFIKKLANEMNESYTLGKTGRECYYTDKGNPIYPGNDGFIGTPETITLKAGMIVDRYGKDSGSFVAPQGTLWGMRALPYKSKDIEYHVYEIIRDIPNVKMGITAPWFGEHGYGIQYKFPDRVRNLEDFLKEVII